MESDGSLTRPWHPIDHSRAALIVGDEFVLVSRDGWNDVFERVSSVALKHFGEEGFPSIGRWRCCASCA